MPFRLKVHMEWNLISAVDGSVNLMSEQSIIYAQWNDPEKKHVGWVAREGAEMYARENLDPLSLTDWEVEEYE